MVTGSELLRWTIALNCSPESLIPSLTMFSVTVAVVAPDAKVTGMLSGWPPEVVV